MTIEILTKQDLRDVLNEVIPPLSNAIAGLQNAVGGLQKDMTEVKQRLTGVEQKVTGLEKDMAEVKRELAKKPDEEKVRQIMHEGLEAVVSADTYRMVKVQ